MNTTVCVDASLVVALLVPECYTAETTALWEQWIKQDVRIAAPALLGYEVTSALYRKVFQGKIAKEDGQAALEHFLAMDIESIHIPELHREAIKLAVEFNRPNTYDTHYLALSNNLACPLWTADERLFNAVTRKFTYIRWVGKTTET